MIKSLVEDSTTHVPYFESKLTTLLKGAFGGNSITSAIITCRMNDENAAETLQALYFGERCSMIQTRRAMLLCQKTRRCKQLIRHCKLASLVYRGWKRGASNTSMSTKNSLPGHRTCKSKEMPCSCEGKGTNHKTK